VKKVPRSGIPPDDPPILGEGSAPILPGEPYRRFREFIAPRADRFGILSQILSNLGLRHRSLIIGKHKHLVILPPREDPAIPDSPGTEDSLSVHEAEQPTVLIAHYDRVDGSPGANDNSAGVFILMEAALRLGLEGLSNWLIIFTDKEELIGGQGIVEQGSYSLALGLKEGGLGGARYYIFDACGTGDTLILSTTVDRLMRRRDSPAIRRSRIQADALRERALLRARGTTERVLEVPTPFSDDAGFLRAGIASQTITMLPWKEASAYAALLELRPSLADNLISREADPFSGNSRKNARQLLKIFLPETWQNLNGPQDSYARLTPEHFNTVMHFALELCRPPAGFIERSVD
jgi:hypothetical protein